MNKKNFKLLYIDETYLSYTIASFATRKDAESWKSFLAYVIKEFAFDDMVIVEL